jgi:hypothetical protein
MHYDQTYAGFKPAGTRSKTILTQHQFSRKMNAVPKTERLDPITGDCSEIA